MNTNGFNSFNNFGSSSGGFSPAALSCSDGHTPQFTSSSGSGLDDLENRLKWLEKEDKKEHKKDKKKKKKHKKNKLPKTCKRCMNGKRHKTIAACRSCPYNRRRSISDIIINGLLLVAGVIINGLSKRYLPSHEKYIDLPPSEYKEH